MNDPFNRKVQFIVEGPTTQSFGEDALAAQQYFNAVSRRPPRSPFRPRIQYRLKRVVIDTIAVSGE